MRIANAPGCAATGRSALFVALLALLWAPELRAQEASSGVGFFDNSSNPALSIIMDMGAFWYSAGEEGRRHHGGHVANHVGPYIQGVELAATTNVDPFFKFEMEFSLVHLHFEQVLVQTTSLPWNLQLRAGQFRTSFGRQNVNCLHQWSFVDHTLALDYLFGPEGLSLPGAELSVLLPLPWYVELVAAVQSGLSRSQWAARLRGLEDLVYTPRLVSFFDLSDDLALQIGLNGSFARSPLPDPMSHDSANRSWILGADVYLKWRPIGSGATGFFFLAWTTEAYLRDLEVPGDLWRDAGGYSQVEVGIARGWQTAARFEMWRRVSGHEPDAQNRRALVGPNSVRGEVSLSYAPSHFSRLRLQYGVEDIESYELNHMVALQLEVSAGAHGAHEY
jgi:hypothetical protein